MITEIKGRKTKFKKQKQNRDCFKMEEWKEMCSFSPERTSKSQLAVEQPSAGGCWSPPKKDTLCPRTKETDFHRTGANRLHSWEGTNKTLCVPGPRGLEQ